VADLMREGSGQHGVRDDISVSADAADGPGVEADIHVGLFSEAEQVGREGGRRGGGGDGREGIADASTVSYS